MLYNVIFLCRVYGRQKLNSLILIPTQMVSKVEGMVLHTSDAHKINGSTPNTSSGSSGVSTSVARTSSQEHNGQLFNLLAQLRDALDKMPANVLTRNSSDGYSKSSSSASGSIGAGGNELVSHHHDDEIEESRMMSLLKQSLKGALTCIDLVISRQLLSPLLEAITTHLKSILLPLLKEGASINRTGMNTETSLGVDCSGPVQALVKLIPEILKVYLISMASCPPLASAVEELGLRVLHLYITVAALVRY